MEGAIQSQRIKNHLEKHHVNDEIIEHKSAYQLQSRRMYMQIPLQITIRDLPHSEAIEMNIHKKVQKLHLYNDRIMSCRVVIDIIQKHKHQGKQYLVRIDLKVPGAELVVNKHRHEDVYVAIRDAFNALVHQLKSLGHKQRGDIKTHETKLYGKVIRLFEDYGFIQSMDGNEYYFHTNHVINNNFEHIAVGTEVNFMEAVVAGETLQANHITVRNSQELI